MRVFKLTLFSFVLFLFINILFLHNSYAATASSLNWQSVSSLPPANTQIYSNPVEYSGYVYLLGGTNVTGTYTINPTSYYAPIESNGQVGTWGTTSSLPENVRFNSIVAYNGYIYSIGGEYTNSSGNVVQAPLYYSQVGPNGVLEPWQTTSSLPSFISDSTTIAYNGYVYSVGGCVEEISQGTCNDSNFVYYSKVGPGGILGLWQSTSSAPVDIGNTIASTFEYGGYVYTVGGSQTNNTNSTVTSVSYSQVGPNGVLEPWQSTSSIPTALFATSTVVYNGYVYAIGSYSGFNNNIGNSASVYYSQIGSNGVVEPWNTATSIPTAEGALATSDAFAYNGYFYFMFPVSAGGGMSGYTISDGTSYYAQIPSDLTSALSNSSSSSTTSTSSTSTSSTSSTPTTSTSSSSSTALPNTGFDLPTYILLLVGSLIVIFTIFSIYYSKAKVPFFSSKLRRKYSR